jgi:hypothetical protein
MTYFDDTDDREFDQIEAASDYEAPPPGTYQARIESLTISETKTPPVRKMLVWTLRIISGPHEGKTLWVRNLGEGESLRFLKRNLTIAGLVHQNILDQNPDTPYITCIAKLSDINDALVRASVIGVILEVTVKITKNGQGRDNVNVYFNKRILTTDTLPLEHEQDPDLPF